MGRTRATLWARSAHSFSPLSSRRNPNLSLALATPWSPRRRRIIPTATGRPRRRDRTQSNGRTTAHRLVRADLRFAASSSRPLRLCSSTVEFRGDSSPPTSLASRRCRGFAPVAANCRGTTMARLGQAPPCSGACRRSRHGRALYFLSLVSNRSLFLSLSALLPIPLIYFVLLSYWPASPY